MPDGPVLITGALGFIGRALGDRLRAEGVEVRGVDVRADAALGVVAGDIAEPGDWQRAAQGCATVVHTAAVVSMARPLAFSWRVNVLGTRRVADAARDAGARLVHLSSVLAFSERDFPDGVTEAHPVRPDGNPYVETKIASEQAVLQAHAAGELPVVVIRPGDVYGPASRPWTLLPLEAIRAHRLILPAGGRGIFSPLYIENLLDGLALAMDHAAAPGQVFTLRDTAATTTRAFFGHYHRMLGLRGPVGVPTPVAIAAAAVASRLAGKSEAGAEANPAAVRYLARTGTYSTEKARRLLSFAPAVDLATGMERTEAWLRETGRLYDTARR